MHVCVCVLEMCMSVKIRHLAVVESMSICIYIRGGTMRDTPEGQEVGNRLP